MDRSEWIRRLLAIEDEDYDLNAMYRGYLDCAATIFGGRVPPKEEILHADDATTRAILAEMETRDPEWLRTGKEPEIGYDKPETKAWKTRTEQARKDHEDELKTAEALKKHGIRCTFVVDQYEETRDGVVHTRGLADCEGGLEIKTLREASSYNTIDSHIKQTSRGKKDAKVIVFNNSLNKSSATDADVARWIKRSHAFKRGKIYLIQRDGSLRRVR